MGYKYGAPGVLVRDFAKILKIPSIGYLKIGEKFPICAWVLKIVLDLFE
jgi:hypothetical protein